MYALHARVREPFLLLHYPEMMATRSMPFEVRAADGPVAALARMPPATGRVVVGFSEGNRKDAPRHGLLAEGIGLLPRPLPFDLHFTRAFALAAEKRLERRAQPD